MTINLNQPVIVIVVTPELLDEVTSRLRDAGAIVTTTEEAAGPGVVKALPAAPLRLVGTK